MNRLFLTAALACTSIAAFLLVIVKMSGSTDGSCMGGMIYGMIALGWMGVMFLISAAWIVGLLLPSKTKYLTNSICHRCGYDLRGTMAASLNRCPECGCEID